MPLADVERGFNVAARTGKIDIQARTEECRDGVVKTCRYAVGKAAMIAIAREDRRTLHDLTLMTTGGGPGAIAFFNGFTAIVLMVEPESTLDERHETFTELFPGGNPMQRTEARLRATRFRLIPMEGVGTMLTVAPVE